MHNIAMKEIIGIERSMVIALIIMMLMKIIVEGRGIMSIKGTSWVLVNVCL